MIIYKDFVVACNYHVLSDESTKLQSHLLDPSERDYFVNAHPQNGSTFECIKFSYSTQYIIKRPRLTNQWFKVPVNSLVVIVIYIKGFKGIV